MFTTIIVLAAALACGVTYYFAYHHGYYNGFHEGSKSMKDAIGKPLAGVEAEPEWPDVIGSGGRAPTEKPVQPAIQTGGTLQSKGMPTTPRPVPLPIPRPEQHKPLPIPRPGQHPSQGHVRQPNGDSDKVQ